MSQPGRGSRFGPKPVSSRHYDALSRIDWRAFERLIADYYRDQGFVVDHSGTGASSRIGFDERLLRASHIKPWKDSSNFERLDGSNGIMLSPHVDAMFDQGLMSFEDNGRAIYRNDLKKDILEKWAIAPSHAATPFQLSQRP